MLIDLQHALLDATPRPHEAARVITRIRALLRSGLWHNTTWPDRSGLPSAGRMPSEASAGRFDSAALPARQQGSLC